jgi:RHS repeat-associated protein
VDTVLCGLQVEPAPGGNQTAKTDWQASVTSNYGYDAIYELTSVLQGANTTESYTYDPVGNRLSSLSVSPYSYNASNELTSTPNATYGYDLNGNAVTKNDSTGITTYAWDFENRLTSVTLPAGGGTVTFAYDPFGRRIEKASSAGTSIYAYDGDNLVEETNSSGAVVARYSQGLNIDEPLAMLRSSTTSFYEADGLGTITSLTNTAGALAQTYTFDSFGKQTASSGSLTNPFQYTGREFDPETSLYYYRARYYDPSIGKFLSEDPSATSSAENLYEYVRNSPITLYDPSGHRGTKPKQSKVPPDAVFYICCKGGMLKVCDKNSGAYDNGWILDCMREHEKQHIKDLTCGGKNPCKGHTNGPLLVDPDTSRKLECAAYRRQLECMLPAPRTKENEDMRGFIKKQIIKYCGAQ